ncbi:hypothetical protein [Saccharopolyspora spinosa]|uniref:Uncharacterized protein n=1 Tax=Saccharopolyspora spinosa TaxID=60894 RepID=A0A2N3XTY6_SACSN|nr:hypothetical protein [Saccharopolyspora spinosa]PKW14071.1 hypothetical protein A8926_1654 [Saccharopolyspora spinosa]
MASTAELLRCHWTRGEPGREAPRELVVALYRWWVAAMVLKIAGATWDICWHFRWLRDDLAPPHLINTVGTVIVIGLVVFHTYTGIGVDRATLRWMQWGLGIFLVAAPLDVINHRINGLDITAWSPSHALLYLGTGLISVGLLRGWARYGGGDRYFYPVTCFLWFTVLDNFLFLNQHQEYGVLGLAAWERGTPYAEDTLLQFAADDLGRPLDWIAVKSFTLPVPDWVYPTWATVTGLGTLVLARRLAGRQWTATTIAAGYLVFRCVAWALLGAAGFPISAVPFFLLAGAVAIDLSFRLAPAIRPFAGAAVVTAVTYLALWMQQTYIASPPVDYWSVLYAVVLFAAVWWLISYLLDTESGRRSWQRVVSRGQTMTGARESTTPKP